MVIHRFCDPSLSCWFEPSARDQQHHAGTRGLPQLKATLRVDWIRPTRTEAEELRWMILFLNRQLRKKHPYVTSWFFSGDVARARPKAALSPSLKRPGHRSVNLQHTRLCSWQG